MLKAEAYDEIALAHRMALVKGFLAAELEQKGQSPEMHTPEVLARSVILVTDMLVRPSIVASHSVATRVLERFGWKHDKEVWYHLHWGRYFFKEALAWALCLPEHAIELR